MKAVRILAQGYKITGDESLKAEAFKAAAFVASRQRSDGSWQYSEATSGRRVDNYHTGYVLDCLHAYEECTGDPSFDETMKRGWHFYRAHFFREGMPAFLSDELYPVDSTAAAQSLLTLCRFGDVEMAREISKWMIGNMQDEKGYFYFRHYKNRIVKTPFMRWSNAWMFAGLAETVNRMEK
jgi:rhamnogalacturonyl hydrolase YesR